MKLNNRKIAIVGAGIAGLATARALALRGARPIVVEQADTLGQIGAGLQITPNGMAVLDGLGLGKRVRDAGLPMDDVVLRDHKAGAQVLRLGLGKGPSAGNWAGIARADLIDVMRVGVERVGAEVRLASRVLRIDTRPQKTILTFADGTTLEAAIVIAADGLHSVGRHTLGGNATPFFTGQVAWRCVIDEAADAPAIAQVFMGPGRHLVSYPLPGGKRNIVAVEERADWAEESWTAPGDPDQLRAAFAGFGGPVADWLRRADAAHIWGLFRHEVPARWHGGSLVLVGDAAHPTLPFLAQGANLALEDAWVLADTLADAPGVSAALTTFQDRRFDRVKRAIRAANANARNYHLRNPLARFAAHSALRFAGMVRPRAALGRFDWLYRHDVTAVGVQTQQHASVPALPPLAVAGEPEVVARTPKPVIPRAKPVIGPRPSKSRITFGRVAAKVLAVDADAPAPFKPAPDEAAGETADEALDEAVEGLPEAAEGPVHKTPATAQPENPAPAAQTGAAPVKAKVSPPTRKPKPAARATGANPYGDDSAAPAKSPKKMARVSPQPKNVAQAGDAQKDAVQKGDAKEGAATSAAPRKPARSKAATPKKTVAKKPKKPAAKPKPKKKT
jgi:salicylate hydroxylase